ncbi:MAG: cation:proton antiporter, partial [Candidatus Rokubacteria bacterium]|nr:cation:proton antiporter [Candidatus Rokubacteria bacterium]
ILAVVTGLVQTGIFSLATVALILAKALVFLVLAVALGIRFAPALLGWVGKMRARGSDPGTLDPFGSGSFRLALVLTLVAVVSKLAAGLGVYRRGVRRWPVGVGMIPRGEVGLIFAGIGLANRVIEQDLYAALVAMIMASTFIVPPWLKVLYGRP